jgi:hypothetical protein
MTLTSSAAAAVRLSSSTALPAIRVQAMATYSASSRGFNPASVTQAPGDTTLPNAIAAAWHQ